VTRHAGQEDLTSLEVDEEKRVEPSQGDGVHVEEVTGERAGGLGSQEVRPRRPGRSWRRTQTVTT
jgi:hypothetical protein